MSQSQIVPVKLADNEKNRKYEDTHKKTPWNRRISFPDEVLICAHSF